jgi:hypothetical protein
MPCTKFVQYILEGPSGRVVISQEKALLLLCDGQVSAGVPWTAGHEALGVWTFEITEDSDAEREAKYIAQLTGLAVPYLASLFRSL